LWKKIKNLDLLPQDGGNTVTYQENRKYPKHCI